MTKAYVFYNVQHSRVREMENVMRCCPFSSMWKIAPIKDDIVPAVFTELTLDNTKGTFTRKGFVVREAVH